MQHPCPVYRTKLFSAWLATVKDVPTRLRIAEAVDALGYGKGDCEPVGEGVSELRLHFGQGWRVYFMTAEDRFYVVLCAGGKKRQQADIDKALAIGERRRALQRARQDEKKVR